MRFCPHCGRELATRDVEDIARNTCAACGFIDWDNPVPVVAALVEFSNKFVLARNAQWPRGIFSVVTGFLEKNETPEAGIAREVQEELGVTSEVREFLGHYSLFRKNQLILAYRVIANAPPGVSAEIVEVELVSPQELATFDVIEAQAVARTLAAHDPRPQRALLPLAAWCIARRRELK